jgi:5'-methylthioadenosine phosphorylase
MERVPEAELAIIGGSSTFAIRFPEAVDCDGVDVMDRDLVFATPYGDSPPFTLFNIDGAAVLTCRMHGWRPGVTRGEASRQVFWVLREAGVTRILAEGGVGAINHLLRPRDLIVPNDYIDCSQRRDVGLGGEYLLIMRQALCPVLRQLLLESAGKVTAARVFDRGIYVCTDGRHFESPAEIRAFRQWGGDIVGQSLCPEVYLAREIGACYASLQLVVNYAEGVVEDWKHDELRELFYSQGQMVGMVLLTALRKALKQPRSCCCSELRKETMLKDLPR